MIPAGVKPYQPDTPWQNCHENFSNNFTPDCSWILDHADVSLSEGDLYKRATENLKWVIGQAIEKARQEKLIGNALEAAVALKSNSEVTAKVSRDELEEFFILSDLSVEPAKEANATVAKTSNARCARCWRHRPTVGKSKAHPDLCDRCEEVVNERNVDKTHLHRSELDE